jgi:tRNA/rRNA methyltransferase/tRNA (cytidine32/uridine32-2'-O)-methyltransferase
MSSALDNVRVVLNEPLDPVNIAGTVRAMKNMGVGSLVLVRPAPYDRYRLEGIAHDTEDVIAAIRTVDSLNEAIDDCVHVAAYTARRRAAKRTVITPRESAVSLIALAAGGPVAVLFGREDRGLDNETLDRAHAVVTIPTTTHSSINLSQAVLIALYELHLAAGDATRALAPPRKDAPLAPTAELEVWFDVVERVLQSVEFFKTNNPELILRSLRSLTYRAAPDLREISLMKAMAYEVLKKNTGR